MLLHAPLRTITPTLDADILSVLAGAENWFTVSQVHTLIPGRSREGIRNALARLADQGIVDTLTLGSMRFHRLNREHLATPAILELAGLRSVFFDRLRNELGLWSPRPQFAAIFGSAAQGRMVPSSDIDLFLLHPGPNISSWDGVVEDLAERASRWTGNAVNPLIMSAAEVDGAGEAEPVLHDIAEHGIPLLGSTRAFRQLIGTANSVRAADS
ncbi:MAG: nucleotidyltransferase domain-containing protein [Brachybacterium sp.]